MNEEIDLNSILTLLRKVWVYLLAAAVVFAAAGSAVSYFLISPKYQSSATMIVNSTVRDNNDSDITYTEINASNMLVNVYAQVIKSEQVLAPVCEKVNSQYGYDLDPDKLVESIAVTPVENTPVMKITVTDLDPNHAKQIAEAIIELAPPRIVDAIEASSCKVISQPQFDDKPVSPNIPRNAVIAALIGVVLCFAFFFLRQMMDNTIKEAEDITSQLGLPALGVIPEANELSKRGGSYDGKYGYGYGYYGHSGKSSKHSSHKSNAGRGK